MNVFFCIHDPVEYDGQSYFSNHISYMIERYADSNDTLTCFAPIVKTNSPKSSRIAKKNVNFINAPKIDSISQFFKMKKYYSNLRELLKGYPVAIIHIHASILNALCVLAAKRNCIPFMTVVVGCAWDALWHHSFKGKLLAPLCYVLERWCQKEAKYSIYVTKSFLQKRYPTHGKWISCSNVELNFNTSPKKRELKSIDEPINIATIAAVNVRYKGQQYVIRALSQLQKICDRNYVYHIIGGGDASYLLSLSKKLNIENNIIFHGPVEHEKIPELLDSIDIYIQPSKQEGLPRAVIEAMSRGCLCIGSDVAGIPELIKPQYLFRPGNYTELTQLLNNVTVEDILREGLENIEKARAYSKEYLDLQRNQFIQKFKQDSTK